MKLNMLLWPHANARYREETLRLAEAELRVMLERLCPEAVIDGVSGGELPTLRFSLPDAALDELLPALRRHSLLYALYEERRGGLLRPLAGRAEAFIGGDLPSILKYKGKTNELFLQLLINVALYSGGFAHRGGETLEFYDPLCGRATSLFVAANYGWNATGSDVDKNDLAEAVRFLKRYFEYHHQKYTMAQESRTLQGGRSVPLTHFGYAAGADAFKKGELRSLRTALCEASKAREAFGREKFHIIAADLPYGVQHSAVSGSTTELLKRALPAWRETLKKGGTVALSFNANTLDRDKLRALLAEAGFEVSAGGVYDAFSHWVEQAVTRDIVVGRRTN